MSYTTADSLPKHITSRKQSTLRNSSTIHSDTNASKSPNNLALFTKTISNYFFKPEKLPIAFEQKSEKRQTAVKPFFTKNRKLLDSKNRMIRNINNPCLMPNGFKNILRAKSTVIKQNKYKEFYINREGRDTQLDRTNYCQFDLEDKKSNLFRSNFPQKKTRNRKIASVNLQSKASKKKPTLENNEDIKIPAKPMPKLVYKALTIQSMTEDLMETALKQKNILHNFIDKSSKKEEKSSKVHQKGIKNRKLTLDKENAEFVIEPWGQLQNEDNGF